MPPDLSHREREGYESDMQRKRPPHGAQPFAVHVQAERMRRQTDGHDQANGQRESADERKTDPKAAVILRSTHYVNRPFMKRPVGYRSIASRRRDRDR